MTLITTSTGRIVGSIVDHRWRNPGSVPLVGLSGIDGSGKSRIAREVGAELRRRGLKPAVLGLDDWHYPQSIRFSEHDPGIHFYVHGFRWAELFDLVVAPLRERRSLHRSFWAVEIGSDRYYRKHYRFREVDVVLLEGIFLFRRDLRPAFDVAWWVECSFHTALRRAIARNQEGLPEAELVAAYQTVYFPAQRYHLAVDRPLSRLDGVILNEHDGVAAAGPQPAIRA